MHFEHPANDWRPAIKVSWYQGGALPESPSRFLDLRRIDHGALFEGTKGYLVSDFGSRALYPNGDQADLTYFKPRTKETVIPPMGNFQKQWLNACKGTGPASTADFLSQAPVTEAFLLGCLAQRLPGQRFEWDTAAGRITNNEAANKWVDPPYRGNWG